MIKENRFVAFDITGLNENVISKLLKYQKQDEMFKKHDVFIVHSLFSA